MLSFFCAFIGDQQETICGRVDLRVARIYLYEPGTIDGHRSAYVEPAPMKTRASRPRSSDQVTTTHPPLDTHIKKTRRFRRVLFKRRFGQSSLVLDFAVQCMTTKKLVVLFLLHTIRLLLFVATGHIAGYWFALGACLSAFDHYVLSSHTKKFSVGF